MRDTKKLIKNVYDYLHENPEISWKEYNTTNYIQKIMEREGLNYRTLKNIPGLVIEIGKGDPVIGIRADMDGLWQMVDDEFCANHSCGHDAHMAIVIGVIDLLKNKIIKGKVKFIFQPAEEIGEGALKLIELKEIDDLDYLFGIHLRPIQELKDGTASPAIMHGACKTIVGKIGGGDSHGARPHLGVNAIEVGASLVYMLKNINLDPFVPASIKLTKFKSGGESANIIPGIAEFSIDIRGQSNGIMQQLEKKLEKAIDSLREFYDAEINYNTKSYIPAAIESQKAQSIMKKAINNVIGQENTALPIITSGGDDFNYYKVNKLTLQSTMLGLGCGLQPGLHHPKMRFNHDAMFTGAKILTEAILIALEKNK